jgi:hypothetical protein
MTGNPTCLTDETWLSIPFSHSFKSNSEKINDILLTIPRFLFELRAKLSCTADLTEEEHLKHGFMQRIGHLMETLDNIQRHMSQSAISNPYFSSQYSTTNLNVDDRYLDCCSSYKFSNAIEAKDVAMHACARIVIFGILASGTLSSQLSSACSFDMQSYYSDQDITRGIEQASTSVLSAATFLSQVEIGCAYIRMILPLQLVAQVSPSHGQRVIARTILQSWWREKPIKGLAGLALQSIDSGSYNLLDILTL